MWTNSQGLTSSTNGASFSSPPLPFQQPGNPGNPGNPGYPGIAGYPGIPGNPGYPGNVSYPPPTGYYGGPSALPGSSLAQPQVAGYYGAAPPHPYDRSSDLPPFQNYPRDQPPVYGTSPGQYPMYGAPPYNSQTFRVSEPNQYGPSAPAAPPDVIKQLYGETRGQSQRQLSGAGDRPEHEPAFLGAPDSAARKLDEPKVLQLKHIERQHAINNYLYGREYWIATDESDSMSTVDCMSGDRRVSRWEALGGRASQIAATAEKYSAHGLKWIRFGTDAVMRENVTADEIKSAFSSVVPDGCTNMTKMLRLFRDNVVQNWKAGNKKPHSLLIFTDGDPTPEEKYQDARAECANVIKDLATELLAFGGNDEDIAISFIQIGYDEKATEFLSYLDDLLKGELSGFDIVDSKHWDTIVLHQLTDEELFLDGMLD